jgi:hypothetical protein
MLLSFTLFSQYFPLDYIFLGSIILYVFTCTMSGIIRIGIRFLWVHLFTIKPRQVRILLYNKMGGGSAICRVVGGNETLFCSAGLTIVCCVLQWGVVC